MATATLVYPPPHTHTQDSPASSSHSTFTHPLDDLNPFFDKQFTKNNTDVFSSYGRLLAEILLVLPCQLKKASESNRNIPPPEFGPDWMATLCDVRVTELLIL